MSISPSIADTEKAAYVAALPQAAVNESKRTPTSPTSWRKLAIILLLCSAQFFYAFSGSVLIILLPVVRDFSTLMSYPPADTCVDRNCIPPYSRTSAMGSYSLCSHARNFSNSIWSIE